eukprot:1054870-Pleurochrysis_carterae.AAC.1
MHEFILRKDGQGVVRIHIRKSSQASTWLPEGPGYEVFKSQPDSEPPLAKLKPDDKWDRSTVEATVRQWLRHFSLTPQELSAVRQEWDARLWSLLPNLDVNDLVSEEKLTWPQFP